MKVLKYIGVGLGVLVLAFVSYALLAPPVSYQSEVVINKPASIVWATMMDPSTQSQWIKGLKKAELLSGTANTVGAVSKITVEDQGQEFEIQETIKAVKPGQMMAMEFSMDMMIQDYQISLTERGGGTTVTSISDCRGNNLMGKAMVPLIKGTMESQEEENLQRLKEIVESSTF